MPTRKPKQPRLSAQEKLAKIARKAPARAASEPPPTDIPLPTDQSPAPAWPWPLRPYQERAEQAFEDGRKRQLLIWHRRAGKDVFGLSKARKEMLQRVGGYWHFFPKHVQARRAIWNGIDPKVGRKFIDIAFGDIINSQNNTEMYLEMTNGSTWQLLGSDNYDRIVGSNACGAVFSEWALCDPRALEYMRPIIRENNGWIILITTYRGRNHAWKMAQTLKDSPDWHVEVLDVTQTQDVNGNRIITDADIEAERRDGMDEGMIQQEYFCNPTAAAAGAVYARQLQRLIDDPRRVDAQWNPAYPVFAAWNLRLLPVSASVVYMQASPRPVIVGAETVLFSTLAETIAKASAHPWPIMSHLLHEDDTALVPALEDLRIYPEIILAPKPGAVETDTQALIERMAMDRSQCGDLIDSLLGYTRREMFSETDSERGFAEDYVDSWHANLVNALELAAAWLRLDVAGAWQAGRSYGTHDKRII